MTGFEPRTSGIGSDHSANWATTTAHIYLFGQIQFNQTGGQPHSDTFLYEVSLNQPLPIVINKFYSSVVMLCWNKAL